MQVVAERVAWWGKSACVRSGMAASRSAIARRRRESQVATPAMSSASVMGMRIRPCSMDCRASNKLIGTSRSLSVCPPGHTACEASARSLCERDSMAPDLSSKTSAAVASAGNTITLCPCAVDAAQLCIAPACSTLRKCSCQPSPDSATRGLPNSGVRLEASQLPPSSVVPQSSGSVK